MDKNKVASLAKSFTSSCKQIVKENQLAQKISSPSTRLIALTVLSVIVTNSDLDKRGGWYI
jgi:hypothetical protein